MRPGQRSRLLFAANLLPFPAFLRSPPTGLFPLPALEKAASGQIWAFRAMPGHKAGVSGLPEAFDPLGQRLRTPAERRVHRRFVSARRLVAGHDAFGQGVLVEVRAPARHSVGEVAYVDADKRALFCPGQLRPGFFMGSTSTPSHAAKPAKLWYVSGRRGPGDTTMAKSIGSTKTAGSRTRNVPTHELGPSAPGNPSQTPRAKTSPQYPVKHSAKATAPKISPGFKLGRLPPDR